MLDSPKARKFATEVVTVLAEPALQANPQSRTFFTEQREALGKALHDSATPEMYKVAVVGSFKVGKSSFVNALCGIKGLASVNSNPETAAITVFRYAERPWGEAHLIRREQWEEMKEVYRVAPDDVRAARYRRLRELEADEGSNLRVDELEHRLVSDEGVLQKIACDDWEGKKGRKTFLDNLARYASRRDPLHYFVDHLLIHVPVPFLKDGIELIDTPGLDDTDRYRVQLTEEYVKEVDAILFLTRSGSSYSQSDKDFVVRQLRRKTLKHLRLVVTKCDETYLNARKDAEDRDEDAPSYDEHLNLERKRVRTELDHTLDELLSATDVAEDSKAYFREQLSDISLDFISSRYHTDGENKGRSGIDALHHKLMVMLQKTERVAAARKTLTDAIVRVCDRSVRFLKARREAVGQDFSHERVKEQIKTVSAKVKGALAGFERKVRDEVKLLKDQTERDKELVEAKIDGMLVRCDGCVDGYAMQDVALHWKTRRYGGWGFLRDIQTGVADTIFPHVELLLKRAVDKFGEAVARIKGQFQVFQQSLGTVEQENRLDKSLQPIRLTERFAERGNAFVEDVGGQVSTRRNKIVRHLDTFVSKEVQGRIAAAKGRVTAIEGTGTTVRQNTQIQGFYRELKQAMRDSLGEYLRAEFTAFGQLLLSRAESIYPDIRQELDLVIDDRLNAIQSGLTVMNDQQKQELLKAIDRVLGQCEAVLKKAVAAPDDR
jgi:predicted GTPase